MGAADIIRYNTAETVRKRGEVLRYLIAFVLLACALAAVLVPAFIIKREAAGRLYENLTFMRIAVEARQSVQKIEYGINNGKDLEQFYGIDNILRGIQRCSSYAEGIYVVNNNDIILYSLQQPGQSGDNLRRPRELSFENENDFHVAGSSDYYDLIVPVFDADGNSPAYVIIRLDKDIVLFSTRDLINTEMMQSFIIGLEMLGLGLIILSIKKPGINGIIALILIFALLALTMDLVLSYIHYGTIAESATTQSVNRIAQMLQSDIDSLTAMGVSSDMIYDTNSWLQKSLRGIPMVHTMSIDSNMRVLLTPSQEYIRGYSTELLINYAIVYAVLLLLGATVITGRIVHIKRKRTIV